MSQNISQQLLSPDKAAAALSLLTKMSEGLMPKQAIEQPQQGSETPESAPEQEQIPEQEIDTKLEENKAPEANFEAKLDVLSQDITSVKEMLQQLLNEKLPE